MDHIRILEDDFRERLTSTGPTIVQPIKETGVGPVLSQIQKEVTTMTCKSFMTRAGPTLVQPIKETGVGAVKPESE